MVIDRFLSRSPFQYVSKRRSLSALAVLAFHGVADEHHFVRLMDYIRAYHPVSVEDVIKAVRGEIVLPGRSVLVTFDDGHREVLEVALPILRERDVPAAVYVVAGLLDTDEPFWWDEVKALVRLGGRADGVPAEIAPADVVRALKRVPNTQRLDAIEQLRRTAPEPAPRMLQLRREELPVLEEGGIAIGNHTLTHPCLHQCDEETIRHELEASQRILTDALGHTPRTLAYPNGDQDPRVRRAVDDLGFEAAFLFDHRLSPVSPPDPLRISRLRVDSDTPLDRFKIILSGLHPAIHHAIGRP